MSDLESKLKEIEAREEKATPGPWGNATDWEYVLPPPEHGEDAAAICEGCNREDSNFIAASRTDIPFLLALVAKYREALEVFENRRKLAYSMREESRHVYAFVEATGCEMDKYTSELTDT